VVTEVLEPRDVELVATWADALQIGTRNMQNFALLKEVGATKKPVMLKRGLSATVEEWLMAAEYIAQRGNSGIILCERGIRTFERSPRARTASWSMSTTTPAARSATARRRSGPRSCRRSRRSCTRSRRRSDAR